MSKQLLKQKRDELAQKSKVLASYFEKAGEDLDFSTVEIPGCTDTKSKVRHIREANKELTDLGIEVEGLQEVVEAAKASSERESELKHPVAGLKQPTKSEQAEPMGFGDLLAESKEFKSGNYMHREISMPNVGLKTLFETGAGWGPENLRIGRVIEDAQRPIQVMDVIPMGSTSENAIVYMEETTFTNNAAEAAEGAQYGESALALTERSSSVRKVAVFIPVTDEQLADVAQARSYLNARLPFMLRQRLDSQLLVGDGIAPNLTGILNVSGVQTQAKGADVTPDAVYKALTKVRVTGQAFPDVAVFNPNDWQDIRLLRTADGIYIWGSPSEAGPERIWGIRVLQAQALTENTGLVGDFRNFCQLFERQGVTVKVSDSHSDFFIKGKLAVRADIRVAFPVYRPEAFCTITGI